MEIESQIVRVEQLPQLAAFCRAVATTLQQPGLEPGGIFVVFRESITAECTQCGAQVPGEELFALSQPEPEHEINAKVRRLRLGDCARPGCESYHYRVIFQPCPGVDWGALVPLIEQTKAELKTDQALAQTTAGRRARWGMVRRVGIALVIVSLLLIIRQWYFGGRIPLVREPEEFRVDPYSPGYQSPQ